MYFDAAARGKIGNKFASSGDFTQHLDLFSADGNRFPRPVNIAAPLLYHPLPRIIPDAHTQRPHGALARDYMLHANACSHLYDATVELVDVAAGKEGDEQRCLFGLAARYFTVIAQEDVRCHELHQLNHVNRD